MRTICRLLIRRGVTTGTPTPLATAVSIGVASLLALGCNRPTYRRDGGQHDATADYAAMGTAPGYCHHCHSGLCPVGVTTQDAELDQRLDLRIVTAVSLRRGKPCTLRQNERVVGLRRCRLTKEELGV